MAQIARSIELDSPVEAIHEEWLRFEANPRCVVHSMAAQVRWRAQVLAFEPIETGTRVTLKLEYDPSAGGVALSARVEAVLGSFAAFLERRGVGAAAAAPQQA